MKTSLTMQSNVKCIFYCNASKSAGLGHLSRCLNIARQISVLSNNPKIYFYGNYDLFAEQKISFYSFKVLKELSDAENTTIICDSYEFSQQHLLNLKRAGFKLCVIDDFNQYNFDFVNLLINFRLNADSFYQTTNPSCLGVNYFSFSPELVALRGEKLALPYKNEIEKVLIFIGGYDAFGVGEKVIAALDQVFTGIDFTLIDKQKPQLNVENNKVEIVGFTEDISIYFADSDLIISGGGLTKYEAGFCLIPNCSVSQTREQHQDTLELAKNNLTYDLGLAEDASVDKLTQGIASFIKQKTKQVTSFVETYNTYSTRNLALEIMKV